MSKAVVSKGHKPLVSYNRLPQLLNVPGVALPTMQVICIVAIVRDHLCVKVVVSPFYGPPSSVYVLIVGSPSPGLWEIQQFAEVLTYPRRGDSIALSSKRGQYF